MKNLAERLEKIFLFLFLLSIPTQLGWHFWPEWSKVAGVRVDYLSPVLYLTDIFWWGWLGTRKRAEMEFRPYTLVMGLALMVLNILAAVNHWEAVYRWLRWAQWGMTVVMVGREKLIIKNYLVKIIPIWITVESLLAASQMFLGRSLGGVWYWLGERSFNLNTIGIAQMSFDNRILLRGYGTFSHPNSLVGFLLLAWWMWDWQSKTGGRKWDFVGRKWDSARTRILIMILTALGVLVGGSRLGWILFGGLVFYKIVEKRKERRKAEMRFRPYVWGGGLVLVGIILVGIGGKFGGWDSESWQKRMMLNSVAVEMIGDNMWTGVGLGNFLVRLPEYSLDANLWRQPVHNIPLLMLAELGVLGILGWLNLGRNKIKGFLIGLKRDAWICLGIVAMTAMFDHYWITLPQNWWLLGLMIGILI